VLDDDEVESATGIDRDEIRKKLAAAQDLAGDVVRWVSSPLISC